MSVTVPECARVCVRAQCVCVCARARARARVCVCVCVWSKKKCWMRDADLSSSQAAFAQPVEEIKIEYWSLGVYFEMRYSLPIKLRKSFWVSQLALVYWRVLKPLEDKHQRDRGRQQVTCIQLTMLYSLFANCDNSNNKASVNQPGTTKHCYYYYFYYCYY